MVKDSIPFWEDAYKDKDAVAFSSEPNITLKEFEYLINTDSQIIDVGCGEGQNAFYLAKHGYCNVTAFDISQNAITKLNMKCAAENIRLNAFTADLRTFRFERNYDLIMSFGTLHFVHKTDWKAFINSAKEHTNSDGIHIMQIFTDTVPASEDIAPFAVGLAKDKEITELYKDWEIMQFKSYIFEDEHPGVPKHLHASNKIVARKI